MNNTKKMILSLIAVAFVNANAVSVVDHFNPNCVDKDGNTIWHKLAQSCHEPDRFTLEIRPMDFINKNVPAEKEYVFQGIAYTAADPLNTIRNIPHLTGINAVVGMFIAQNTMQVLQILHSQDTRNNAGEGVLDILRQQHDAHPEADWCTFLKHAFEIDEVLKKAEREAQKAVTSVETVIAEQQ